MVGRTGGYVIHAGRAGEAGGEAGGGGGGGDPHRAWRCGNGSGGGWEGARSDMRGWGRTGEELCWTDAGCAGVEW